MILSIKNKLTVATIAFVLQSTVLIASKSLASSRDYSPDFASEDYWREHQIGLVHVTAVNEGGQSISVSVDEWLANDPGWTEKNIDVSDLRFGSSIMSSEIRKGECLILCFKTDKSPAIPAVQLGSDQNSTLAQSVRRVAQLRGKENLRALSDGVFDPDQITALYCLQRMMTAHVATSTDYVAKLIALRNSESPDVRVRLAANDLAKMLDKNAVTIDGEYEWLQSAVEQSKQSSFWQLIPLVNRMKQDDSKSQ